MKKAFDCIVCPMSCHLEVEEINGKISVTGNSCPRGAAFGKQELVEPMRMLTTTVRIKQALYPLLPVITSTNVSKAKLFAIIEACKTVQVTAPIKVNQIIVKNIADSGADLIASRSMERRNVDDQAEHTAGNHRLENV